ncbi:MAG: hypothetical protein K2M91_10990 [Lachnospiraceae bacterium]|nr:hypothetical protein [Lachnospiraceae bacterium]
MRRIVLNSPDDSFEITVRDIKKLKAKMMKDFMDYWQEGSGEGDIQIFKNNKIQSTLMIEPSLELERIYLHYIDNVNGRDLLSVYDKNNLEETIEIGDEIYASEGLFLPLELVWKGIEEYVKTGGASGQIDWITPEDVPENGNW